MIKVIGNKNCSHCEMVKQKLKQNNIEFEYVLFTEVENSLELRKEAMKKGLMSFPMILENGSLVDLQEVLA